MALHRSFHGTVMLNFAIAVHDCFFPFPLLVLILLLSHRRAALVDAVSHALERRKVRMAEIERTKTTAASSSERTDTSAASSIVTATRPSVPATPTAKRHFRSDMWREGLELLVDTPFLLCGLLVVLTVWRADILVKTICTPPAGHAAAQRYPKDHIVFLRKAALRQFVLLFRDIPFLAPFLLLFGTLYRFYPYFTKLLAKASVFLDTDPLLTVETITIKFGATAAPTITVRARKPCSLKVRSAAFRRLFWPRGKGHNYVGHNHIGHNYIGHNYSRLQFGGCVGPEEEALVRRRHFVTVLATHLHRYGLCSCGLRRRHFVTVFANHLHSYGLHSYGLHSYGL